MTRRACCPYLMSLDGHQYYIVAYGYHNNFIETKEVSDLKDETVVETVQKIYDKMEAHGHRPLPNVTDNQAAQPPKAFLKKKNASGNLSNPTIIE